MFVALTPAIHKPHQERALDQFYTRSDVAQACVAHLLNVIGTKPGTLFIEPAAGAGAFLDALPEPRIGFDLAPARADIAQADFLHWHPAIQAERLIVVSNFPFGKNASLAVKFVNHAAQFADFIASIVPRSFEKNSIKHRISSRLTLVSELPLAPDSFLYQNQPYSVPVLFQIWQRRSRPSPDPQPRCHADFSFLRAPAEADFAFQRVGVQAGRVSIAGLARAAQSHYFIAVRNPTRDVAGILASIDWTAIKSRTAGNPSIGKAELITAYQAVLNQTQL